MWTVTPKDLVVESTGHLKPALPLGLGQARAFTNSASTVYNRKKSRYSNKSKLISHHPCP